MLESEDIIDDFFRPTPALALTLPLHFYYPELVVAPFYATGSIV